MQKFKDSTGREWSVALNGWTLKKLKDELNFDARDHRSILNAASDPLLLLDVLYVLSAGKTGDKDVTKDEFLQVMDGDCIEAAVEAYMQEIVNFSPRQKPALQAMLARMNETQDRATALATEKLTSPAMSQLIETAMKDQGAKIDDLLAGANTGNSSGKSLA